MPNQHRATPRSPVSRSDPEPAASFGKSEKETAWPPPAGPLAGDTRSIARGGSATRTRTTEAPGRPRRTRSVPRASPRRRRRRRRRRRVGAPLFGAGRLHDGERRRDDDGSAEETIAPSSPPKRNPTARCMSTPARAARAAAARVDGGGIRRVRPRRLRSRTFDQSRPRPRRRRRQSRSDRAGRRTPPTMTSRRALASHPRRRGTRRRRRGAKSGPRPKPPPLTLFAQTAAQNFPESVVTRPSVA